MKNKNIEEKNDNQKSGSIQPLKEFLNKNSENLGN
jgi:hypothetical protein